MSSRPEVPASAGTTSVRKALAAAERRLSALLGAPPRQDAEILMAHALGVTVGDMHLRHLDDAAPPGFEVLVGRRLAGEPIPYVTGRAGFWTIELEVGPGALIPRADTETLIAAAFEHFAGTAGPGTILDLGTGAGPLLLAALDQWPEAQGLGVDASDDALAYAWRNAGRLGMSGRAKFRQGDWAEGIDGPFDLVLANPPYVEADTSLDMSVVDWEPAPALFGGPDGLDPYRRIAPALPRLVASGGFAAIEHGAGQGATVAALFEGESFRISSRADLRGIRRCLTLAA